MACDGLQWFAKNFIDNSYENIYIDGKKKSHTISNYDKDKKTRQRKISCGTPFNASIPAQTCDPTQGAEQNSLRLATGAARAGAEKVFLAYDQPLGSIISFRYLGILLSATENDWPDVVAKFRK